jgi:hypothetical protein
MASSDPDLPLNIELKRLFSRPELGMEEKAHEFRGTGASLYVDEPAAR